MKSFSKLTFWIASSAIAFGFASLFHFLYEWTGESEIAGIFFPVNESIWEHGKLCFYPILIVWILFGWMRRKYVTFGRVLNCFAVSSLFCLYGIYSGYYLLLYGFRIEGLWIDLILLGVGILFGQGLGIHVLQKKTGSIVAWIYLILGSCAFAYFTCYPLSFPIFQG